MLRAFDMRPSAIHRGLRVHGLRLLAACVALGLLGCVQAEGETCQLDSDCDDGLACQREGQSARGVCIVANDAGPPPDDRDGEAKLRDDDAG
jgi:hypothetical protein